MNASAQHLSRAIGADLNRILDQRVPEGLAHAKSVYARSERRVLWFTFSVVPIWMLAVVFLSTGLLDAIIGVLVPAATTLAFLVVVIRSSAQNRAAARPIIEYARSQFGIDVTRVTKSGVVVAAPRGPVDVPAEFLQTRQALAQP